MNRRTRRPPHHQPRIDPIDPSCESRKILAELATRDLPRFIRSLEPRYRPLAESGRLRLVVVALCDADLTIAGPHTHDEQVALVLSAARALLSGES